MSPSRPAPPCPQGIRHDPSRQVERPPRSSDRPENSSIHNPERHTRWEQQQSQGSLSKPSQPRAHHEVQPASHDHPHGGHHRRAEHVHSVSRRQDSNRAVQYRGNHSRQRQQDNRRYNHPSRHDNARNGRDQRNSRDSHADRAHSRSWRSDSHPGGQLGSSNHDGRNQHELRNSKTTSSSSRPQPNAPFVLLLVGIPGSGKSTFAKSLESYAPNKYVRVNQDTLGTRQACEERTLQVLASGKCPIIDRCNFDAGQRMHFLRIARAKNVAVECVVLRFAVEECVQRCENRSEHETISPEIAREVVERMARQFVSPENSEGFRRVSHLVNLKQVNELLLEYSNKI